MARAYTLNIAADTRAVKVGIDKGVIEPLDDALEVLEDIGRNRDLDKLEQQAEDAQDQTEKVKKEFSELAQEIRNTGRKAKTDFGDKVRQAADDGSEGMKELKDEGSGTAKELAASFDGSMDSISGGIQEVAANAFSGFGPAGAAAGIAAALGLGAITAELTKQQEEAEETKQALIDMYREAIDEGRNYLSEAQILGAITPLLLDTEKQEEFRKKAAEINVDVLTYTRAQAGSYEDLQIVIDAAKKADEERGSGAEVNSKQAQAAALEEKNALARIIAENEVLIEQHDANKLGAEAVAQARADSEKRQRDQINHTRDTSQARYEAEAIALGKLPKSVAVKVDLVEPDVDAITRNIQRRASQTRIRYEAAVFTQNGTQVY